jgi:hypothetical protein
VGKGYTWHYITDEERQAAAAQEEAAKAEWLLLGYSPRKWDWRGEATEQGDDGRFVRRRPLPSLPGYASQPPSSAPADRCQLYRRAQGPYYKSVPKAVLLAGMPEQMRAALQMPGAELTSVWGPAEDDLRANLERLLDGIGECLCPRARLRSRVDDDAPCTSTGPQPLVTDVLSGSEAFAQPLDPAGGRSQCMLLSPSLVHRTVPPQSHMSVDRRGYLRVTLANISVGRGGTSRASGSLCKVSEWAHRIVTWAMYGPPSGLQNPEVMHVCDPATGEGNPRCLNPQHMVWGERAENSARPADRAGKFGLERRKAQRGF